MRLVALEYHETLQLIICRMSITEHLYLEVDHHLRAMQGLRTCEISKIGHPTTAGISEVLPSRATALYRGVHRPSRSVYRRGNVSMCRGTRARLPNFATVILRLPCPKTGIRHNTLSSTVETIHVSLPRSPFPF